MEGAAERLLGGRLRTGEAGFVVVVAVDRAGESGLRGGRVDGGGGGMYDPGEGGDSSPPVENLARDVDFPLPRFDNFFDSVCDESPFPLSCFSDACFSEPRCNPNALLSSA